MKRFAFKMYLKSGCEHEYERRHAAIWPELVQMIKDAGVSNYSIFWDKDTNILFGYQECEGEGSSQDTDDVDPITQKWWDMMADIMEVNPDNSPVTIPLFLLVLAMTLLGRLTLRAAVPEVKWDKYSLIIDGQRVMPVMGEIHYSRVPAEEWGCEVRKMKEGGVTMIATYVFWNHIEEQEGIFRWDGQRSLRAFLEVCRQEQMPVILRLGPFCHGEVRNGGIPDWMFAKGCRLREENSTFLGYVETLYRQIFTQVQGLQWKDGGPVIAAQFDNEYRGRGEYLMALKKIALQVGFDLPFYTRTGWPALRTPVPYGEMIPLYGDYADGFWDKEVKEGVGNYYKAFNFKAFRSSTAIGTDLLGKQEAKLNTGRAVSLLHL